MPLVSTTDIAPRARVSSDRWFSNVVGSSSRRRWTGSEPDSSSSLYHICRATGRRPSACSRRTISLATLHPTFCAILFLFLAVLSPARAYIYTPPDYPEALQLRDILVDPRYAPEAPADTLRRRRELLPRADNDPPDDNSSPTKSSTKSPEPTSRFQAVATTAFPSSANTAAASATSSGGIVTESGTPTGQLPRPFDTSLGNNFTNPSCPQFFNTFLSDPTLTSCLPLSLLLMVCISHAQFRLHLHPERRS